MARPDDRCQSSSAQRASPVSVAWKPVVPFPSAMKYGIGAEISNGARVACDEAARMLVPRAIAAARNGDILRIGVGIICVSARALSGLGARGSEPAVLRGNIRRSQWLGDCSDHY